LLPTAIGFLIDVAVFSGVDVTTSGLSGKAAAVLAASSHDPATF
jgi:hypothetical protein